MPTTPTINALLRRAVSLTKAAPGCGLRVIHVRCLSSAPHERRLQVTFDVQPEPVIGSPYLAEPPDDADEAVLRQVAEAAS